jgi:hypothetical protein
VKLGLIAVLGLLAAGCGDSAAADAIGDGDYMDDDIPAGNCGPTGCGSDGGVPVGFPCAGSTECSGDAVCVAPFVEGEVGEFVCGAQCIPLMDEASWCLDASACCDANAVCSPRGLCIEGPVSADDTTGGASSGTDTGANATGATEAGTDSGDSGGSSGDGTSSSTTSG